MKLGFFQQPKQQLNVTEPSQEEKLAREIFGRRKAAEWQVLNREAAVRDTYMTAIAMVKKEMSDHGIKEEEYEQYLKDQVVTLH